MRFLLNCSRPFTRSAVTVEGDRADRDLDNLRFHCSFAEDVGFQWLDAFVIFFMCHALIVTNEAAIIQLGERLCEVPKV